MRSSRWLFLVLLAACSRGEVDLRVGSKSFTESVILGEVLHGALEVDGYAVEHVRELGGTRVLWNGLRSGEIDAYVEYSGTLEREIFEGEAMELGALEDACAAERVAMLGALGFENRYAIGMRRERARALGIRRVSDLRDHPELVFGFSNEFMDRPDGWPGLRAAYALPQGEVTGMDHDLAYRALASGDLDALDLYTTDAEIEHYDLVALEDDLGHFGRYEAVVMTRDDLPREAQLRLLSLVGSIGATRMQGMNRAVKIDGQAESRVAADFLQTLGVESSLREDRGLALFWRHTREHLLMVFVSLLAAILAAVPIGVVAARRPRLGAWALAAIGMVQTVPALALLVFMIPLLGIGTAPALAALFLYSLLPIARNTHAGLRGIPDELLEAAEVLGLDRRTRLRRIELPLASRSILAGVQTAAVLNVGFATLGAFIGAGGYGQAILTGIRLDDASLTFLQGALPAAVLALVLQGLFHALGRWVVPRGLRLRELAGDSSL